MDLPSELICSIGAYLDPHDMAQLCLVSKEWNSQWTPLLYAYVQATGLMMELELTRDWESPKETEANSRGTPDIVPSLRKHAHLIRSFSLTRFGTLEFDCVMQCLSSPVTRVPESHMLSLSPDTGGLSKIVLKNFEPTSHIINRLHMEQPNLREIVIHPTAYANDQSLRFEELFEVLPKWKLLERFEYHCRRHHFDTPFSPIVQFLNKCPRLRHLVLLSPIIEGFEDLSTITKTPHHFPHLITLKLPTFSWYRIQEKSGIHPGLSFLLRQCPTLQSLSITGQLPFERAETPENQQWKYALANNTALKKIEMLPDRVRMNMDDLQVQHNAAVSAISALLSQSLTSIHLEKAFQKTSDETLVELFTQCKNLQDVSLHHSDLSDTALEALASVQESLQACRRPTLVGLRSLCLQSCHNISATPLARILYCCKGIVSLVVVDCSPIALALFTPPRAIISASTVEKEVESAGTAEASISNARPSDALWACTDRLEKLHLDLNAGRYKVDVAQASDLADQDEDTPEAYSDIDDDWDSDSSDEGEADTEPAYDQRIPDAFVDNEMALIRRQLDALVKLRELRLEGVAMSYDLLLVPEGFNSHTRQDSVSSSSSLSCSEEQKLQSPSQSSDDPGSTVARKRQKRSRRLYRVIRPLTTGLLATIRIVTNMYFPNQSGHYQRISHPTNHEITKEMNTVKEWWHNHAAALLEKGSVGTEYHPRFNKVVFRVYNPAEHSTY
ncbi:hypothetical protein BGZ73_005197 [Actinomortierella ambigua]|nr:hypothetical protein BGZ73_005197 [Actinomortierella ambigua]